MCVNHESHFLCVQLRQSGPCLGSKEESRVTVPDSSPSSVRGSNQVPGADSHKLELAGTVGAKVVDYSSEESEPNVKKKKKKKRNVKQVDEAVADALKEKHKGCV